MAVAVKTNPGTPSAGSRATPALVSLVGVVVLLACLAIVFKLVPSLWWSGWESLGWGQSRFVGGALLLVAEVAIAFLLLRLCLALLGPEPPAGARAGVAFGVLGLLAAVLLARWASLWVEHFAYQRGALDRTTGLAVCAAIAAALLIGWAVLLLRPATQAWLAQVEAAGWFSATSYKSNQGQRVRRATVLGLLMLVGAGIYTLLTHNVLTRTAPDWSHAVPFTSKVAVDAYGDTADFLKGLPAADKAEVQVTAAGKSAFHDGQVVPFTAYKEAVEAALQGKDVPGFREAAGEGEPTAFLSAVAKNVFDPQLRKVLAGNALTGSALARLKSLYDQTAYEGVGDVVPAFERELKAAKRFDESAYEWGVPAAVLVLDRYTLRAENAKTDPSRFTKISLPGSTKFEFGQIVSRKEFADEVDRIQEGIKAGRVLEVPDSVELRPAYGRTTATTLTLLPAVQYTVPLLLLAVSMWLAWRVVNMPTFADFLIATEAELNKVSWTSQKRLIQDTVVVLVTLVMMSLFLFGMDYTWKVLLSNWPIKVLHIPPADVSQQNKSVEQKRW